MEIKIINVKKSKDIFYYVDANETFESIADVLNLPVEYIKSNNPGGIYRGKVIFLPEIDFKTYIVKPFDTLQKIAAQFGTSVEALKEKNNLSNEYVFIGQKIYI